MKTVCPTDTGTRAQHRAVVAVVDGNASQQFFDVQLPLFKAASNLIKGFVDTIPAVLQNPSTVVAEPIAAADATTYGSQTLYAFAELKRREAAGTLHPEEAEYARYGTATSRRLEKRLADICGAELALTFPSENSAFEKIIDSLCPASPEKRAHFVVGIDGYLRSRGRLDALVNRGWIELSVVSEARLSQYHDHLRPNTAAIFYEAAADHKLREEQIGCLKRHLNQSGSKALLVVDQTGGKLLEPQALSSGADLIVSSLSLYGGSDKQVFASVVAGNNRDIVTRVRDLRGQSAMPRDGECLAIERGVSQVESGPPLKESHSSCSPPFLSKGGSVHENGTVVSRRIEGKLAELEGAESALIFPSGMAAIEKVLDSLIPNRREKPHFIVGTEGYRQTRNILDRFVARGWLELTVIPMDHFDRLQDHLKPTTAAVFFETPSNPYLRVIDIAAVKRQIQQAGSEALVVVDHTFAGPLNQQPLKQGADLVVPSLTKYVGGDNTVLAGAVAGSEALIRRIRPLRGQAAVARDEECLRVERGIDSLPSRTERSNLNGAHVAELLARNSNVRQLWYPGHPSHPDYAIAKRTMNGFAGVVTFRLKARDFHDVAAFTDAFVAASPKGTFIGPSFGGELPLVSVVPIVSHFSQSPEERRARNIPDDLIRLSVGTGLPQTLTDALQAAFTALEARRGPVE